MRDLGTHSFVLLLLATAPASAQSVSGRVLGFDGKPAAGAVVEYTMASGRGALLTDAEGRFAKQCPEQAASLHAQLEGVRLPIPHAAGETTGLEVSFANAPHFTLRGQVLLPDGTPATGKDVLCRNAAGGALATATTDERGNWTMRLGEPVRELAVDPAGWQHVVAGPFTPDRIVLVDLQQSADSWFRLQGRVFDETGPCAGAVVRAHLDGWWIVRTRTRADGSYTLWTNHPVESIDVVRTVPIRRKGPFTKSTTALDLDEREHGLVLFTGRFLTGDGAPIGRAMIFGVDADGPPPKGARPDGVTDAEGRFRVLMPRATPFVFAVRDSATAVSGTAAIPADRSPFEVRAQR